MTEPAISAIHHVTLNVHDLERSERWYTDVLGFSRLQAYSTPHFQRVIMRHPSGIVLGVNKHNDPDAEAAFSERRTGLDHLAFQTAGREQLDAWVSQFDEHGVEHSDVKPGAVPGSFLVTFRDPDGIQLEVFAPASP